MDSGIFERETALGAPGGYFRRYQFGTAVLLLIYQTALACPVTQGGDNIPNRVSYCQGAHCDPKWQSFSFLQSRSDPLATALCSPWE